MIAGNYLITNYKYNNNDRHLVPIRCISIYNVFITFDPLSTT